MSQDDQLPPRPTMLKPKGFDSVTEGLPPLSPHSTIHEGKYSDVSDLQSDDMDRLSLSKFFDSLKPDQAWTPLKLIAVIFIFSFLFSILFTSAILAGLIEIHPGAIKGFLKAFIGKT
jgi:hypothetical protein